jgi:hypothetical protein
MLKKIITWLESHQLSCSIQKQFGINCPGCGFQSALIELLKGNIWESVLIYPALLPIIATVSSFLIQLKFNTKIGALIVKVFFFLSLILVLANFISKLLF